MNILEQNKTLYLWDLADTLFSERWDKGGTGILNYDAYIESLGYDLKTIDAKTYEWLYEQPFRDGRMILGLMPGFKEILTWAKHNAVFTTGNIEQIDWRAEVFIKKEVGDVRKFFEKIYSTFDYGNTNQKTEQMFLDILRKESMNGRSALVYADNRLDNCEQFKQAAQKYSAIKTQLYHINSNALKIREIATNFFEVSGLPELLKNEQNRSLKIS